jgi:hypothetical protein
MMWHSIFLKTFYDFASKGRVDELLTYYDNKSQKELMTPNNVKLHNNDVDKFDDCWNHNNLSNLCVCN